MPAQKNKRFGLLLYQRYHQINSGVSVFLMGLGVVMLAGTGAAWLWWKEVGADGLRALFWSALAFLVLGLLRFLFTLAVSKITYVECRPKSLKIQTTFLPLVISYRRVVDTRPSALREIFPPEEQKRNRDLLEAHWGDTVVIVDVNGFPMPVKFMRVMMGPYFFTPDGNGLVLLVKNWMELSQRLDQALTQYRGQRGTAVYQPRR